MKRRQRKNDKEGASGSAQADESSSSGDNIYVPQVKESKPMLSRILDNSPLAFSGTDAEGDFLQFQRNRLHADTLNRIKVLVLYVLLVNLRMARFGKQGNGTWALACGAAIMVVCLGGGMLNTLQPDTLLRRSQAFAFLLRLLAACFCLTFQHARIATPGILPSPLPLVIHQGHLLLLLALPLITRLRFVPNAGAALLALGAVLARNGGGCARLAGTASFAEDCRRLSRVTRLGSGLARALLLVPLDPLGLETDGVLPCEINAAFVQVCAVILSVLLLMGVEVWQRRTFLKQRAQMLGEDGEAQAAAWPVGSPAGVHRVAHTVVGVVWGACFLWLAVLLLLMHAVAVEP